MNYTLIKDTLELLAEFENQNNNLNKSTATVDDFKKWIVLMNTDIENEPNWEGKEKGRSAESAINTLIVHMNRYARSYSKSAIFGSDFSSQEEFIYLINLKALGGMAKMDLIKKNVHEKSVGIQTINRLIAKGWVNQADSKTDKRSKILKISDEGIQVLEAQMANIRKATKIVTGNLTRNEKMELIRLLNKLDDFHKPIYDKNIEPEYLLDEVLKKEKQ